MNNKKYNQKEEERKIYELFTKAGLNTACKDYDKSHNNSLENFCNEHKSKYMPIDWRPKLVDSITGDVDFEAFEEFYEDKIFPIFKSKHGVNRMFMRFGGNRVFLIKVPDTYVYGDEFYYIHGIKRASLVAHIISMQLDGEEVSIYTKDHRVVMKLNCNMHNQKSYRLKIYADAYDPKHVDSFDDCLQSLSSIADVLSIKYGDNTAKEIDKITKRIKILLNNKGIEINYKGEVENG